MDYTNRGAISTQLTPDALATLRADDSLGSANFFDRCRALSSTCDVPFLYLDRPFSLADGKTISELSLDTLQQYRIVLAAWYLKRGVVQGDVVTVCVEDGIGPFLHYLALTSLGAAISLINPAMPAKVGIAYMQENDFDELVVDRQTLAAGGFPSEWRAAGGACVIVDAGAAADSFGTHGHGATGMPEWWPRQPQDSTLVMLSHTSGTTGLPKAVRFEHRQFFMGKRARIGRFAQGPDERLLTALPQSHSAAISHLETAVLHGIPTWVLGTQDGATVREAIARFAPTTVVAFPKSYMLLVEGGIGDNEFSSVRRWFSMGDAAHQSHTRRLLAGAPQSIFIDAFGSSELGMALFRSESSLAAIAPQRCIGRPVEIAVAKILDADTGEEIAAGEIGLLAVRAPTITSGYWRKPGQTIGAWRGGYFLTGDVAYCHNGAFYQIDRAVDVVAAASGPLYTLELEEVAQQIPGVCDVCVVGLDVVANTRQPILLAVVLSDRNVGVRLATIAGGVLDAMRKAVEAHGGTLAEGGAAVAIVRDLAFLPAGATGKVLKRLLREQAPAILRQEPGQHGAMPELLYVSWPSVSGIGAPEPVAGIAV